MLQTTDFVMSVLIFKVTNQHTTLTPHMPLPTLLAPRTDRTIRQMIRIHLGVFRPLHPRECHTWNVSITSTSLPTSLPTVLPTLAIHVGNLLAAARIGPIAIILMIRDVRTMEAVAMVTTMVVAMVVMDFHHGWGMLVLHANVLPL